MELKALLFATLSELPNPPTVQSRETLYYCVCCSRGIRMFSVRSVATKKAFNPPIWTQIV